VSAIEEFNGHKYKVAGTIHEAQALFPRGTRVMTMRPPDNNESFVGVWGTVHDHDGEVETLQIKYDRQGPYVPDHDFWWGHYSCYGVLVEEPAPAVKMEDLFKNTKETAMAKKKESKTTAEEYDAEGVMIPIRKGKVDFVPTADDILGQEDLIRKVALSIKMQIPVLLVGETGTGKTSLVRHLASKTNNGFRRVNHNGGTTVDDVQGKILVNTKEGTYWVDGVLIDAMRKGHWYLADEINASSPEINFLYHSLLDDDGYVVLVENGGEIVIPHEDFRFFGGMNPTYSYAGTKEMNKALLSRFAVFNVEYPDPSSEAKILKDRTGVMDKAAKRMVAFAVEVREMHRKDKVDFALSTRDLLIWAKFVQEMRKFIPSAEVAILNKVGIDDIDAVRSILELHFTSIDSGKAPSDSFTTFGD